MLQSMWLQRVRHDLVTEQPLFTQGYFFFFPIGWNWRNTANSFRVSGLEDRQTFVELILSASHSLTSRRSSSASHSVVPDSLWPHGLWSSRLRCPWDSPGKNIGVGRHSLLQNIGIKFIKKFFFIQNFMRCLFFFNFTVINVLITYTSWNKNLSKMWKMPTIISCTVHPWSILSSSNFSQWG